MNKKDYLRDKYGESVIEEVKEFLNYLRLTGGLNMFGAAPYIASKFKVSTEDARMFLSVWMSDFN